MTLNLRSLWGLIGVAAGEEIPVVLVDGGSGSGKTSFAHRLAEAGPPDTRVVSMDDFYPGWGGLAEGTRIVEEQLLVGDEPGYTRWNWELNQPGEWVPVSFGDPVIIEGCGALTPTSAGLSSFSIWLELDARTRMHRALERDGEAYRPHWGEWAGQEKVHWERHRPWTLADLVLRRGS